MEDGVCPSCGNWLPLVEHTGWCLTCTRGTNSNVLICEGCGLEFKSRGQNKHLCSTCERSLWLEKHADRIERYMAAGLTVDLAIQRIRTIDARPVCLSCGNRVKGGNRGRTLFCRASRKCRTTARRYKWLRDYHNMSKEDALVKVLNELKDNNAKV